MFDKIYDLKEAFFQDTITSSNFPPDSLINTLGTTDSGISYIVNSTGVTITNFNNNIFFTETINTNNINSNVYTINLNNYSLLASPLSD